MEVHRFVTHKDEKTHENHIMCHIFKEWQDFPELNSERSFLAPASEYIAEKCEACKHYMRWDKLTHFRLKVDRFCGKISDLQLPGFIAWAANLHAFTIAADRNANMIRHLEGILDLMRKKIPDSIAVIGSYPASLMGFGVDREDRHLMLEVYVNVPYVEISDEVVTNLDLRRQPWQPRSATLGKLLIVLLDALSNHLGLKGAWCPLIDSPVIIVELGHARFTIFCSPLGSEGLSFKR